MIFIYFIHKKNLELPGKLLFNIKINTLLSATNYNSEFDNDNLSKDFAIFCTKHITLSKQTVKL